MVTKISKWSRIQDSFRITPQNWITGSLCHSRHTLKISKRSVHNFLSYLANTDRQTNKQTKSGKNITSLAEVMNRELCECARTGPAHWLRMPAVHVHRESSVAGTYLRDHSRCCCHRAGVSDRRTAGVIDWHELHSDVSIHWVRRRSPSCWAWMWQGKQSRLILSNAMVMIIIVNIITCQCHWLAWTAL